MPATPDTLASGLSLASSAEANSPRDPVGGERSPGRVGADPSARSATAAHASVALPTRA